MEEPFKGWPRCDLCHGPVNPQFGRLSVEPDDWPAQWIWSHDHCLWKCLPENTYIIEAERLDTRAKVLALTLCLAKEAWYQDTNWEEAVERFYDLPDA